jgi:hypothetical protein
MKDWITHTPQTSDDPIPLATLTSDAGIAHSPLAPCGRGAGGEGYFPFPEQTKNSQEALPPHLPDTTSPQGVVELLLKNRTRLDQLLRDEREQRKLIPQLLAVAVIGFAIYGVVATIVLNGLGATYGIWWNWVPAAHSADRSVGNLLLAYTIGLIAANGVCLPSFYFYSLLAGVRTSMLSVAAQAAKGMAAGAIALVGILPIYMALALSAIVFNTAPSLVESWVMLGLALPFFAGVWGATCLYEGFVGLADTIPAACRTDRTCFLRRLILAWCGCYTLVTPLMIYTLWNFCARATGI